MNRGAVVLAAFGTSTAARDTYGHIAEQMKARLPEADFFPAFSSVTLRKKMKAGNVIWKSPEEVVRELELGGYSHAVVQSLHIVPGYEFEKVRGSVCSSQMDITTGMPLMSSADDCEDVLEALSSLIRDQEECATILAGHGTTHDGGTRMYRFFESRLQRRYPHNVYVCMMEGEPSWEKVRNAIRQTRCRRVRIIPLMLVAGEHMANDVMGDHPASWASQLEGFSVQAFEKGLGRNDAIVSIFWKHVKRAWDELQVSRSAAGL